MERSYRARSHHFLGERDKVRHSRRAREMVYVIETFVFEGSRKLRFYDIHFAERETSIRKKRFYVLPLACYEIVDRAHPVPFGEYHAAEVRADKTGPTGNEN